MEFTLVEYLDEVVAILKQCRKRIKGKEKDLDDNHKLCSKEHDYILEAIAIVKAARKELNTRS